MELHLIETVSHQELSLDDLKSNTQINVITSNTKDKVINFISNNGINVKNINLDKTFGIFLHQDNYESIVGLFSFENKHVSSKFRLEDIGGESRHFSEITHIIIDQRLIDMIFLQKCFSIIIPQLLISMPVNEVIWCEYKNELWSKIISSFAKKIEYDYANESHYFADKIVSSYEFGKKRETHLQELIRKASL